MTKPPPLSGLTPGQHRLLSFLQTFIDLHGYTPNYDQIAKGIGQKSKSGVHRLVSQLCERGYLKRLPQRSRTLTILVRV